MGALEEIDWDKLDSEMYSAIAHASAGTDFCIPDLQLAVNGCITEVKRALKTMEENGSSYNTRSLKLPGVNMVETVIINQHEGTSIEQRAKIAAIVRETYEYLAGQLQASA